MRVDLLLRAQAPAAPQIQALHAYILHEMPDLLHHLVKGAVQNRGNSSRLLVLRRITKSPLPAACAASHNRWMGSRDAPHNPPADHPCPE